MNELTPIEAQQLAQELLLTHGLEGWTVKLTDSRRLHGRCWKGRKLIELSRRLLFSHGTKELKDTILHEIAHALSPVCGHGKEWRDIAYRIGVRDGRYGRYCLTKAVRDPAPVDRAKEDDRKLTKARRMVARTQTRIKRLQTALKKWQRRERLYQKRVEKVKG